MIDCITNHPSNC